MGQLSYVCWVDSRALCTRSNRSPIISPWASKRVECETDRISLAVYSNQRVSKPLSHCRGYIEPFIGSSIGVLVIDPLPYP